MGKQKAKFLKVICDRCGNRQTVYGKATIKVKCFRCNKLLVKTQGGKTKIRTFVKEVL